jgi:hypothetical protein
LFCARTAVARTSAVNIHNGLRINMNPPRRATS